MPSAVPSVPNITSLLASAFELGVPEKSLHDELQAAGVSILQLSVSGKKSLFAPTAELQQFLMARAKPVHLGSAEPPTTPTSRPTTVAARLRAQEVELAALRAKLTAIEAGLRGGA